MIDALESAEATPTALQMINEVLREMSHPCSAKQTELQFSKELNRVHLKKHF